jgi:hypothetical protein
MTSWSANGKASSEFIVFGRSARHPRVADGRGLRSARFRVDVSLCSSRYIYIVNSKGVQRDFVASWRSVHNGHNRPKYPVLIMAAWRQTVVNKVWYGELCLIFKGFDWLRRPQLVATISLMSSFHTYILWGCRAHAPELATNRIPVPTLRA